VGEWSTGGVADGSGLAMHEAINKLIAKVIKPRAFMGESVSQITTESSYPLPGKEGDLGAEQIVDTQVM